jgi:excisionase family DNA binding protein
MPKNKPSTNQNIRERQMPKQKLDTSRSSKTFSPTLYSVDETAAMLGVSKRSVYRWIRNGHLPTKRIGPSGRLIRITAEALEAFINANESEA